MHIQEAIQQVHDSMTTLRLSAPSGGSATLASELQRQGARLSQLRLLAAWAEAFEHVQARLPPKTDPQFASMDALVRVTRAQLEYEFASAGVTR